MNKKGFVIPLIIAIVAVLVIGGGYWYDVYRGNKYHEVYLPNPNQNTSTTTNPIIGGDKDEHGCLGPAGYSWCAVKNKCLRVWEEKCEIAPVSTTTNPVACTMDAKLCSDGSYVGRTGPKCEFVCPVGYHDVKYFFDTLEPFSESIPRSGITREVVIRGKIIQKEAKVLCIKAPCNPIKVFVFEDINNINYSIGIYETNSLLSKLVIDGVYILKGELQIDADFGLKTVHINDFKPTEIVRNY